MSAESKWKKQNAREGIETLMADIVLQVALDCAGANPDGAI
jgi:hypothetical protein